MSIARAVLAGCTAAAMVLPCTTAAVPNQRLIVPIFTQDPAVLQQSVNAIASCPSASAIVIDFGIGCGTSSPNSALATVVASAQAKGLKVYGYVTSALACDTRVCSTAACQPGCDTAFPHDVESMKRYIDDWYDWYKLDGIFFDEGLKSGDPCIHDRYYQPLYDYVKTAINPNARGRTVLLNMSGYQQDPRVFSLADIVLLWEGAATEYLGCDPAVQPCYVEPPSSFFDQTHPRTFSNTMLLAHSVSSTQLSTVIQLFGDATHNAGWVYAYDGTAAAYDHVPYYWSTECSMVGQPHWTLDSREDCYDMGYRSCYSRLWTPSCPDRPVEGKTCTTVGGRCYSIVSSRFVETYWCSW